MDVVALQEVVRATLGAYRRDLPSLGLTHIVDSFELAADQELLTGPRRYGELLASRYPLTPLDPEAFDVPWRERVLSARLHLPAGDIELHTTHVPPGVSHDWLKIEHFEGVYERLACASDVPRILCGDFNSPRSESSDGTVTTWGSSERWQRGERSIIVDLAAYNLPDVFRALNGFEASDCSWYWHGGGRQIGRRFDHVFASRELRPARCWYAHHLRESGLSDHSPILVEFSLG